MLSLITRLARRVDPSWPGTEAAPAVDVVSSGLRVRWLHTDGRIALELSLIALPDLGYSQIYRSDPGARERHLCASRVEN